MLKRFSSLTLSIIILLVAAVSAGGLAVLLKNPFELFDSAWELSLLSASGNGAYLSEPTSPLEGENRYIVKFKDEIADSELLSLLDGVDYRQIAGSESRLFVISDTSGALEELAPSLEYYETDSTRQTLASDPIKQSAHTILDLSGALALTKGNIDVTVAVLDTGVNRQHEDLQGVNILPGYNAMQKRSGIDSDPAGHGTAVIGLIAAASGNGKGIAGVASGVTILPIKISDGQTEIYSSDLISGIRFAADSGAKVINLSVGGFSPSYAEQEAVDYALSKGCILIAAAGNGGDLPYGDQKSYPASYDGVISVASCDTNGKRSSFSQYNDAVDVAAPGENITVLSNESSSSYRTDSGTSYSAAFVSGIAALALSANIGIRLESEEFMSLIVSACGQSRTDALGHGVINAKNIVSESKYPIITGVSDGSVYTDSVTIGFNRGSATLDGEPAEDGESVVANGSHTLTVTDGERTKTVNFKLNYDPLYFDFREFNGYAYFEFNRGSATLDGFSYSSKEKISSSGIHKFILTDGAERREKEFSLGYALPTVFGVENGKTYDAPREILIVGDGSATLDGVPVSGKAVVATAGAHTLTVESANGAIKSAVSFTLSRGISDSEWIYAGARTAFDTENGWFAVYNDDLVGFAVFDISNPEKYLHFVSVGNVSGHTFDGESVIFYGESGISVFKRSELKGADPKPTKVLSPEGFSLFTALGGVLYAIGGSVLYTVDSEGSATRLATLPFEPERALSDGESLAFVSGKTGEILITGKLGNKLLKIDTAPFGDKESLVFANGIFAVGGKAFDSNSGSLVYEAASGKIIYADSESIFTDTSIINRESGVKAASLPFPTANLEILEGSVWLFGRNPRLAIVSGGENYAKYGAAESVSDFLSEPERVNPYRVNAFYNRYSEPLFAETVSGKVALIFENDSRLYTLDEKTLSPSASVDLRYTPSGLIATEGYIAVLFGSVNEFFLAPVSDIRSGKYIKTPDVCTSLVIKDRALYLAIGGKLYNSPLDGSRMREIAVSATEILLHEGKFVILHGNAVSIYDSALARRRSFAVGGGHMSLGDRLAVGNSLYNIESGKEQKLDSPILAIKGDAVITEKGVYSIGRGKYVGSLGVASPKAACIGSGAVVFGDALASFIGYENGVSLTASAEIGGVENAKTYTDSVTPSFKRGVGYLDGKQYTSGTPVTSVGTHTLLVSLPCGRSESVSFTVAAKVSGISFVHSAHTVSVGDSITLRLKYLPDGADRVPVTYTCTGDGISLSDGATVTAKKEGKYTVTATAVTSYGTFKAECLITVESNLISPPKDSPLSVDRDRGLLVGIPVGTSVATLKSMFSGAGEIKVYTKSGAEKNTTVGTGDRIALFRDGKQRDSLTASVVGDTDGDAAITAYDIFVLERVLKEGSEDGAVFSACDLNANGAVANADLRLLKNRLLGKAEGSVGDTEPSLFGKSLVQTVSTVKTGDTIDAAICFSGAKHTRGVSGKLKISGGLTLVGGAAIGWKTEYYQNGNEITFYAYPENGEECGTAFEAVLRLRFRVDSPTGETVSITSDGFRIASDRGCSMLKFEPRSLTVTEQVIGDLKIEFKNAYEFNFDPEIREYSVTVPYNTAVADIALTLPEGYSASYGSFAIPQSGRTAVNINLTGENGESASYVLRIERDDPPSFDSDCHLSSLEVEGFHLTPSFTPNILTYQLSVPRGTERINVFATPQNKLAEVIIGSTELTEEENLITIAVGTPDGESLTYTLTVTLRDPEPQAEEKSDALPIALTAAVLTLLVGAIVAYSYKKRTAEQTPDGDIKGE